jgi:hypothetical protein
MTNTRNLRKQNLARRMSNLRDHLKVYWKYRRAGDQANQDAGKHIPISRHRREGAQRKDTRKDRAALIEYCYCVALDFFPDKTVWDEDGTPLFDFDLHEVGKRWYAAADLGGDAVYRQRHPKACVRFHGVQANISQVRKAVRVLKEALRGFPELEESPRARSCLYEPFAAQGHIFTEWDGFKSNQGYARNALCDERLNDANRSIWEACEFVRGYCAGNKDMKVTMTKDPRVDYHRIQNSLDPVVGAEVWEDHRGENVNIITAPPRDVIEFSFMYFSKRVTQFAAFLIPKSYLFDEDWPKERTFFINYVAATGRLAIIQLEDCWWIIIFKTSAWRSKLLGRQNKFYLKFNGLSFKGGVGPGRPKLSEDEKNKRKAERNEDRRIYNLLRRRKGS